MTMELRYRRTRNSVLRTRHNPDLTSELQDPSSEIRAARFGAARGFTLIELLVVIAILGVLAVLVGGILGSFRATQMLEGGADATASALDRARSEAVAGASGKPHGVHVSGSTLVLFAGPSYSANDSSNETIKLLGNVSASSVTLAGGGSDVIFDQLTGATKQPGTIVLSVAGNVTRQKIITVTGAGIVSVQ